MRVAPGADDRIYVDLGDHQRHVAEVTSNGWRIVKDVAVKFRRPPGMRSLPRPTPDGNVNDIKSVVNVSPETWPLFATPMVAALRPIGPYPVVTFLGEQGSGKSAAARVFKSLIDPNAAPIRSEPREVRDLMIAARNGWVVALDNLSRIHP